MLSCTYFWEDTETDTVHCHTRLGSVGISLLTKLSHLCLITIEYSNLGNYLVCLYVKVMYKEKKFPQSWVSVLDDWKGDGPVKDPLCFCCVFDPFLAVVSSCSNSCFAFAKTYCS